MSGKKLTVTTIVTGEPGSGVPFVTLKPGDTVPDWATDQVGDHCFAPQDEAEPDANDQADPTVAELDADERSASTAKASRSGRGKSESE